MEKKYEFIEHTADLGFKAFGASLEALFAHAAEAFFEALVDLKTIEERTERSIETRAGALDDLMLNWLDEFLYLYDTEGLLFKRFQIQSIKENHIQARASGEILDPSRHEIRAGIKAVTYHQLYVEERNGLWEAQVILDI